jgi:thymidylate kinase
MTIRDCLTIAIDGTHASGKTTLIHALTAHYRRQGVNVAAMGEPARSSPFMEEIVIHGRGNFDFAAEVDVFAAHLQYQLSERSRRTKRRDGGRKDSKDAGPRSCGCSRLSIR